MKRNRDEEGEPVREPRGKRWTYATRRKEDPFVSLDTENTLNVGNPSIPEPVHRVSQRSHGLSLRHRKKATIASIKQTCEYFEAKCAGKYSAKALAARYLFELSREVQVSLKDIQEVIDTKNDRIKFLEKHVLDWEDSFGSAKIKPAEDAGSARGFDAGIRSTATPAKVKQLLEEMTKRVSQLEQEVKEKDEKLSKHLKEAKVEVLDQFSLLREEQKADTERIKREYSEKLDNARKALKKEYEDAYGPLDAKHIRRNLQAAEKANSEIARLRKKLQKCEAEKQELYDQHNSSKQETARRYEAKVKSIEVGLRKEYTDEIEALKLKAESINVLLKEQREDYKEQLASKAAAIGDEYEDRLRREENKSSTLNTENEYLRGRVKELNKLLKAYQVAVEPP